MREHRTRRFQRNEELEGLLAQLSKLLAPAEEAALQTKPPHALPILLVIGPPRSGTTLMVQWLAATGCFAYPTNLLSRFYAAPVVGAHIQKLLTSPRYAYGDELYDIARPFDFESNLGKTRGALAPNEFWYFWRRFLPVEEIEPIGAERLGDVDADGLRLSLEGLAAAFELPLAMKGMIIQYDVEAFARILPTAVFVHMRRSPRHNVQSILEARENFFGDRSRWYSAKPPEFAALAARTPIEQAVGQVEHTHRHIREAFRALDSHRHLTVEYEQLCDEPARVYEDLRVRLDALGCKLPESYTGPESFRCGNHERLAAEEMRQVESALDSLQRGL